MMQAPPVAILLSTWNGATYLQDQLASFLRLTGPDWLLFWRDDGSGDRSVDIMRAFGDAEGAGRLMDRNDNRGRIGITASFLSLLRRAPVRLRRGVRRSGRCLAARKTGPRRGGAGAGRPRHAGAVLRAPIAGQCHARPHQAQRARDRAAGISRRP